MFCKKFYGTEQQHHHGYSCCSVALLLCSIAAPYHYIINKTRFIALDKQQIHKTVITD